jgi:hypothetical protein
MIPVGRIAGVAAGAAGLSAFAAPLAARGGEHDIATPTTSAAIGAGAGLAVVGGGIGAARWGEHALRPALSRGGRIGAAIGAGMLVGALSGGVMAHVTDRTQVHRQVSAARTELETERQRADAKDSSVPDLQERTSGLHELADEAESAPRARRIDDGRIDLVGAPIGAAAATLFAQYDRPNKGLWLGDQQRTVGERTFSIGPLMQELIGDQVAKRGAEAVLVEEPSRLEHVLRTKVDHASTGTVGVIDAEEAAGWYDDPDAVGEKDISWRWDSYVEELATRQELDLRERSWGLGRFSDSVPLLALVGVDSLEDARHLAHQATVGRSLMAVAVVKLPDDAPTRWALASVTADGNPHRFGSLGATFHIGGLLDERVEAVVDSAGSEWDRTQLRAPKETADESAAP